MDCNGRHIILPLLIAVVMCLKGADGQGYDVKYNLKVICCIIKIIFCTEYVIRQVPIQFQFKNLNIKKEFITHTLIIHVAAGGTEKHVEL